MSARSVGVAIEEADQHALAVAAPHFCEPRARPIYDPATVGPESGKAA